jgi:homoserine dehydrogenase
VVKVIRESLQGNDITRVYGILNGTCNYILTRMEREGRSFAEVLKEAQAQGYAEADPSFDIGGFDTAHKLALLTSLAFGTRTSFESIYVEGIEQITPADIEAAADLGYRIKLLGVALRTESGIEQRVHPTMVPKHTAIAEVDGVLNCVAIDGDFVGEVVLIGQGAGGSATASAVAGDLIDIARGNILPPFGATAKALKPYKKAQMRAHEGGYYIRLSVYDRPGAFAAIAARMADQGISIESIVQRRAGAELPGSNRRDEGAPAFVVMITHQTSEAAIRKALAAIERDGHVDQKPQMIRIEKL